MSYVNKISDVIAANAKLFANGDQDKFQQFIDCPIVHLMDKPPFVHTRLIGERMVSYVWDTREIIAIEEGRRLSIGVDCTIHPYDSDEPLSEPIELTPYTLKFLGNNHYVN
jgi:hypothetical protein